MVTAQLLHLEHDGFRKFRQLEPDDSYSETRESPERSSTDDRNATRQSPAPAANPQNPGSRSELLKLSQPCWSPIPDTGRC
jgi:hypothetical protein